MSSSKLGPPIVEAKTIAQANSAYFSIPFLMNRSVGWAEFKSIKLLIKTVQSNTEIVILECLKDSITFKDGKYWGTFRNSDADKQKLFQVGQYYKAQLAYEKTDNELGFYSTATVFKFTSVPTVSIQSLVSGGQLNIHTYNYTGVYKNEKDASEKVYSYEFNLYNNKGKLVATSGEMLHNSSFDTETTSSSDIWTTRYGFEPNQVCSLVYKIKTINGLECSSQPYQIIDNQEAESSLFQYCDFIATKILNSACIKLTIEPRSTAPAANKKFINGKFVLLRSSSEDNFKTWHELTRFILTSHDVSQIKFICNDYCVTQGVKYKYSLQAYNSQGLYSRREESAIIDMDFEDMFLSDEERQLRIKFNPKVSSFKNTILESKINTIGGKHPFFFRNGNVNYKEFPISGLISVLMDEEEEFIKGIQITKSSRSSTPAPETDAQDLTTSLTGDNFRREREFKLEVLDWLTNGKPKLFRSPGEGNYIVRLMNTSLSPNDTLGRMIHTFNSTAYEIADYTFENLRKYNMMVDEYLEIRDLKFETIKLQEQGTAINLNACVATLHALPGTRFRMKLQDSENDYEVLSVGNTGMYIFPNEVLAENPLMEILPPEDAPQTGDYWFPEATLVYAVYITGEIDNFSYIHSIEIEDKISQWIGRNQREADARVDKDKILKSIGLVYYLNVSKRHFVTNVSVTQNGNEYIFTKGEDPYDRKGNEIIVFNNIAYDGLTGRPINGPIDFNFQLRTGDEMINLEGSDFSDNPIDNGIFTNTGGRIVLTNVEDVDCLYLGNGLYMDIAYQELNKTYTMEMKEGHPVWLAKKQWENSNSVTDWNNYYNTLKEYLTKEQEGLIIDAI